MTLQVVGQMAFLVAFASIVAFGIQNVALAYVLRRRRRCS